MTPVLLHTALVPFRDSYTEHSLVGTTFVGIARRLRALGGEAVVLANNELADRLVKSDPEAALVLMRCTQGEEARLRALYRPWDATALAEWVALARGEGPAAALVGEILGRVRAETGFGAALSWGDDGGFKAFCDREGIRRLHLELGPTRSPFPESLYFDAEGTNALARLRGLPEPEGAGEGWPPLPFWTASWFREHHDPAKPGPLDRALTWRHVPPALRLVWDRPLCYLPLQLADDLNLQLGSEFGSPAEFLRAAVPAARAAGLLPVVKPHPHAHTRPLNLIAQAEALEELEGLGEHALVEDVEAGLWLLANAAVVVTVNSSVGFEAALFGTPVALAGEAAYDFGLLPRLGRCDLAAVAAGEAEGRDGGRGGATLHRMVSRMLCEVLYPSDILQGWRFPRALLAALEEEGPLDEGLRRHLGAPRELNADPALLRREAAAAGTAVPGTIPGTTPGAAPIALGWFLGERVVVRGGEVRVGALSFPHRPGGLVGRAAVSPLDRAPGGGAAAPKATPGATPGSTPGTHLVRGYVYRNRDRTSAAGVLCVLDGRVIAAEPASRPRPDLERKRLPSHRVGFDFEVALPAGTPIDAVRILPFDLGAGACLWALEDGAAQVAGS